MTWSPRTPDEIGLPWFPVKEPASQLDGELNAYAAVLDSHVTESIEALWIRLSGSSADATDGFEFEIYDTGDLTGETISTSTYRPSATASNTDVSAYISASFTTSNIWQAIDEATNTPGTYGTIATWDADFLTPEFAGGGVASFRFNNIENTLDGDQILAVTVRAYINLMKLDPQAGGSTITPFVRFDGGKHPGRPFTISDDAPAGYAVIEYTWTACPWTRAAWTIADVEAFDDAVADAEAGWIFGATGTTQSLPVIFRGELIVTHAAADPRVAVGSLLDPVGTGWYRVEMRAPATGAVSAWSKFTLARYLIVGRRRTGGGFASWRYLDSGESMPHNWQSGRPPVDPAYYRLAGLETGDPLDFGDLDRTGGYAIALQRDDDAISTDSQPYWSISDEWCFVDTTQTLEQEITTPAGNRAYPYVQAMVALADDDVTANLTVTLRARSAPNTVIATATITPDDLDDAPTIFQRAGVFFTVAPTLTGATQYFLRFTATADARAGWRVQVLSASTLNNPGTAPVGLAAATAGAGTDQLTVGSTEYDYLDAAVTLHTTPVAPANFAATEEGEVDCVDWVNLDWDATALGDDFHAYEIQRSSDGGATWECVRRITTEATETFEDHYAPRNVTSTYRLRVIRTDHSPSLWVTDTAAPAMSCCGWVFASNDTTHGPFWFDGVGPHAYDFVEVVDTVRLHGRDLQVAVRESEDRGDRWKATLVLAAEGAVDPVATPAVAGRRAFDDLLILAGNKRDPDTGSKVVADQVAVLDQHGNRWLASIETPTGVRDAGGIYLLDIIVTEVDDHPICRDDPIITEGS